MQHRRRTGRRARLIALALALIAPMFAVVQLAGSPAAQAAPETPNFPAAIDSYAAYVGRDQCLGRVEQPGVQAVRQILNRAYETHWSNIWRACASRPSEHHEGRALDYGLDVGDPEENAIANDFLTWLLATDRHGNQHANARRLGVMHLIWNKRQWGSYRADEGWRPYSCDGSPGDCHTNHIHISLSWAGARKQTSWWQAAPEPDLPDIGLPGGRSFGAEGQHHVYTQGVGNQIVHVNYNNANPGWRTEQLTGAVAGQPASYYANDIHHVYARDSGNRLWHWWYNMNNPGWNRAEIGSTIAGQPTAYYADGVHHVYARGAGNELFHWWYTDSNPGWQRATLDGAIADAPTAYYADGTHRVYARDGNGRIWHWWYTTGWNRAVLLNTAGSTTHTATGIPTAYAANEIHHVYARDANGKLLHWWYNMKNPGWGLANLTDQATEPAGGNPRPAMTDNPTAYYGDGGHHIYTRGANGNVQHWWYTDANPGWKVQVLPTTITGSPTAYLMNRIHHVYARAAGSTDLRHLYYRDYNPGWNTETIAADIQ
jgi:hypothetical protein